MNADKLSDKPRKKVGNLVKSIYYEGEAWIPSEQAEKLLGISKPAIHKQAKRGKLVTKYFDQNGDPIRTTTNYARGGSYKRLFIILSSLPLEAQERYLEQVRDEGLREAAPQLTDSEIAFLRELPPKEEDQVRYRLLLVKKAIAAGRGQPGRIAKEARVDDGTLSRWILGYKKEGIDFLRDRRHKRGTSLSEDHQKIAFTLYADRQQPSYQQAHKALVRWCRKQGISEPSYSATYRFLKEVPPVLVDYWRRGGKFSREHYIPPILRSLDDLSVMGIWMADATTLDVFCIHPRFKNPIRPCLIVWKDVKSGFTVGHRIAPTISTVTVTLAFRDGVMGFGLPEGIFLDRGKEVRNRNWCGEMVSYGGLDVHVMGKWERLGIKPMYAPPFHPQSKAQVERWFNTLSHGYENLLPGYSGANITAKTKRKDQERLTKEIKEGALLSFDELVAALGGAIEADNYRPKKALDNRSPARVFEQGYGQPRLISERSLDFCLAKQKVATIKSGGIAVREIGVTYLSYDPMFIKNIGRPGLVRYDPLDVSKAHLSAIVNGREVYCCALQPRERVPFCASEAELKEALAKKRKASKLIAEAARAMRTKEIDVRAELREASFAVDPERKEAFERAITAKRSEGNVVQLIPGMPPQEKKGEKETPFIGLFDPVDGEDPWGEEEAEAPVLLGLFD